MSAPVSTDEPSRPIPRWAIVAGIAVALALVLFFGWLIEACVSARATSRRFVAAVREGRLAEATELTSPALRAMLVPTARESDPWRTWTLLRTTPHPDIGTTQLGFGDGFVRFACFDGELANERKYWIVVGEIDRTWRIIDLRSDAMPKVCEGSH